MRRSSFAIVFAFVALLTMAFPAGAAYDENEKSWEGYECDGVGTWHFVLNRFDRSLETEANQTLTVQFSGNEYALVNSKQTRGTQHWTVEGSGSVVSATTSGDTGWLVLSDVNCDYDKKDPDPKK